MRGFNNQTENNHQSVSLLSSPNQSDFLKLMTQDFTITTNNSTGKFNHIILMCSSKVISSYIKNNPNNFQYHLDIQDDSNVLGKFEQIYHGESIVFPNEDIHLVQEIIKMLNMNDFPDLLKTYQSRICQTIKITLFKRLSTTNFVIQTNKYEYNCNICGVYSSSVIKKFISENPLLYYFKLDYADEEGEFRYIKSIFNFESVELTRKNCTVIKEIAQNLGIDCILQTLEEFIQNNEKFSQKIDDQQEIIDSIEDLFDFLYNIKDKNIDSAIELIKDSKWSQTKENVYEFAAFIIQVIQTSIDHHKSLIDLLVKLDETDEFKDLLLPYIVKQSLLIFSEQSLSNLSFDLIFPFVYKLYQKGIISKGILMNKLSTCQMNNSFLISWFLPELSEINPKYKDIVYDFVNSNSSCYLLKSNRKKLLYPCTHNDNMFTKYKEERDKGECDSEIEKAIRNDDVDAFQSFVSKSLNNKLLKEKIKNQNIFEPYLTDNTRYLNYAAAHGSIKCFKYMLLNDEKVDGATFEMAVIGGNNEIIRIVDNEKIEGKDFILNAIKQSIKMHKNDLFDWILEQKFSIINSNNDLLSLIFCSLINGNIHSFVQIIDYGFDFNYNQKYFSEYLGKLSQKGFYSFATFLIKLITQFIETVPSINSKDSVFYDNFLIFKLFENQFDVNGLESALYFACEFGSINIIKYFFDNIISKKVTLNSSNSYNILFKSLDNHSKEFIEYLIDSIIKFYKFDVKSLLNLLNSAFDKTNINAIIKISELLYKYNSENDFTELFSKTVKLELIEISKLYIDKKYSINFLELDQSIPSYNIDLFLYIINNVSPEYKESLIDCINKAIKCHNIEVVKYLLTQDINMDKALLTAVKSNDYKIFDLILNSGRKIKNIKWQLEKSLKYIIEGNIIDTKQINSFLLDIIKSNHVNLNYRTLTNTLLTYCCNCRFIGVVKLLLQNETVDVNLNAFKTGNTPLLISINNKSNELSKLLIEHPKINVNQMNYDGETPLLLAVKTHQIFIINLILKNKNFNPEESKLNHSFYISNTDISQLLLSLDSLDVNYVPDERKNTYFLVKNKKSIPQTSLIESMIKNDQQQFDSIIKHPSFNKNPTRVLEALYVSLYENTSNYFVKILESNDNIDIYSSIFEDNSILIESIKNPSELKIESIINYSNFNSKRGKIDQAFRSIFNNLTNSSNSLRFANNTGLLSILNILYNFDIAHDHLIDNIIKQKDNKILTNLLIMKFNGSKKKDYLCYNLKQSIEGDQNLFALSIINSNIIDLKESIQDKMVYGFKNHNNTTYLHLAARYSKLRIIEEIVSKKLCDLNIVNNLGETPLFEACKAQKIECIKYLFKFDDLDYNHVNNKGEDVLTIIRKKIQSRNGEMTSQDKTVFSNKEEYLSEVLKELNELQNLQKNEPSLSQPFSESTQTNSKFVFTRIKNMPVKNSDTNQNQPSKPQRSWGTANQDDNKAKNTSPFQKFQGWKQPSNDFKKSNSGWTKK